MGATHIVLKNATEESGARIRHAEAEVQLHQDIQASPKTLEPEFHYDDTTNVVQLTNNQGIGSTSGADGTLLNTTFLRDQSYHLTLSPDGTKVFTSSFGRGFFAAD